MMETSRNQFKIPIGYSTVGKEVWKYFKTLEDANVYAERVRRRTGVFVTIVKAGGQGKGQAGKRQAEVK